MGISNQVFGSTSSYRKGNSPESGEEMHQKRKARRGKSKEA